MEEIPDDFSQLSGTLLELIARECSGTKSSQRASEVLGERQRLGETPISHWRVGPIKQEEDVRLTGVVAARSADEAIRIFREEIAGQVCESRIKLELSDPRVKGMCVILMFIVWN